LVVSLETMWIQFLPFWPRYNNGDYVICCDVTFRCTSSKWLGHWPFWSLSDNGISPRPEWAGQHADTESALFGQETSVEEQATRVCLETELGYAAAVGCMLFYLFFVLFYYMFYTHIMSFTVAVFEQFICMFFFV